MCAPVGPVFPGSCALVPGALDQERAFLPRHLRRVLSPAGLQRLGRQRTGAAAMHKFIAHGPIFNGANAALFVLSADPADENERQ